MRQEIINIMRQIEEYGICSHVLAGRFAKAIANGKIAVALRILLEDPKARATAGAMDTYYPWILVHTRQHRLYEIEYDAYNMIVRITQQ